MSNFGLTAPVVFVIFNRPDTTVKVFNEIKKARPAKLYVIADGPRENVPDDKDRCRETRSVIDNVDWDCEVMKNYSEVNLGCGIRPSSGFSWVFEQEEYAIILEDDCVPSQSFFKFCQEMLILYKDDTRIWVVSGNNYTEERKRNKDSYFFSRYGHSWGWATWKRAWEHFDYYMKTWPKFRDRKYMYDIFNSKKEIEYFTKNFNNVYKDPSSVWDYQFAFTIFSNGGLSIVPSSNLVTNIGFVGTHSNQKNKYHKRPVNDKFEVIKHPDFIIRNTWYDDYHFLHHQYRRKNFLRNFITIIKKILKKVYKHVKN